MRSAAFLSLLLLATTSLAAEDPAAKYFAGVKLVDQDGRDTDLYSLMKDRTIVINTFFATCTASCPLMARSLGALQQKFSDRLGKDLVLVSITVDPLTDTPAALKAYAKSVNAGKNWYFLTGSKEQVDFALKKIGQWVETRDAHTNVMTVGNNKTGLWKKLSGVAKADDIAVVVASVLNDAPQEPAK